MNFASLGLAQELLHAIKVIGFKTLTPIQQEAIPAARRGIDLLATAQTGTGKTAGFSLPILNRLMPLATENTSPARHPVRALILTPTRELADQVAANVFTYAKHTPLRSTVLSCFWKLSLALLKVMNSMN